MALLVRNTPMINSSLLSTGISPYSIQLFNDTTKKRRGASRLASGVFVDSLAYMNVWLLAAVADANHFSRVSVVY